jgi:hypothetical protein
MVDFPSDDGAEKDVQIFSDMPNHGDQGDPNHHDADTNDEDAITGKDLGYDGAHDMMHDDHDHHKAQSDNDYHDDGHGHDDYADDMDADDLAPSMPRNLPSSSASTPTQFLSPPSQATTGSSGPGCC